MPGLCFLCALCVSYYCLRRRLKNFQPQKTQVNHRGKHCIKMLLCHLWSIDACGAWFVGGFKVIGRALWLRYHKRMDGSGFSQLAGRLLSALSNAQSGGAAVQPNAQIPVSSLPPTALEAFAAAQQAGTSLRATISRVHKDGTVTLKTEFGELRLNSFGGGAAGGKGEAQAGQAATTGSPSSQPGLASLLARFQAGDGVRLEIPADAFNRGAETLKLRVSAGPAGTGVQAAPQDTAQAASVRGAETPLDIRLQGGAAPQNTGQTGRLLALTPEQVQNFLQRREAIQIVRNSAQIPDNISKINIDASRINNSIAARTGQAETSRLLPPPPYSGAQGTGSGTATQLPHIQQNITIYQGVRQNAQTIQTSGTAPQSTGINSQISYNINILNRISESNIQNSGATDSNRTVNTLPVSTSARAGSVTAQVVGFTADRTPILQLQNTQITPSPQQSPAPSEQLYRLQVPAAVQRSLSVGSVVELTPQSAPAGAPSSASAAAATSASALPLTPGFFLTPGPWPSLSEAYQSLSTSHPAMAQVMQNVTPNNASPGAAAQMIPAAMMFVAAARGGDLQGWMGTRLVETLRSAGKTDLLNRLGQEGQALSRLMAEPLSQDWRAMIFPYLNQGEMHKMTLYYKREDDGAEDGADKGKAARFIFDMKLTEMGKMQLDGLFRPKQLDLILRSPAPLSPAMRTELRGLYTESLESSGLAGALSFQSGQQHFFHVTPAQDGFEDLF